MEIVKIKTEASYVNHSVKSNKAIDLQFKMPYAMLTQYIRSIQMLNENVLVAVKVGTDKKPIKLGTFMIHSINIDRDGEGKIKFNSQLDYVDGNAINDLAMRTDEPLFVYMKAEIDLEEDIDDEESEA